MGDENVASGPLDLTRLAAWRAAVPSYLHFGTSSWNYPGWQDLVYHRTYPARGAAARMLEEYARFPLFTTVGIDSTFYRPPSPSTFSSYRRHLPSDFPCWSKVWDHITVHTWSGKRDPGRRGESNPQFLSASLFEDEVLGPALDHFAEHQAGFIFEFQQIADDRFTPDRFADRLDRFFDQLPRTARYAVEVRNPEFLHPAYFAVLREHNVAHLFNAWTRMPPLEAQIGLANVVTADFLIARALLQPGRTYGEAVDRFEPYDRIRQRQPAMRRGLVGICRMAERLRLPAYLLVNNRAEGSAPRTIAALVRTLATGEED